MARHPILDADGERQLERLIQAGVRQQIAAEVMGVSTRTVRRVVARRRAQHGDPNLDKLLVEFQDFQELELPPDLAVEPSGQGASPRRRALQARQPGPADFLRTVEEMVERADLSPAHLEVGLAVGLRRAARRDPASAAWLLERLFPERWERVDRRPSQPPRQDDLGLP